jgi:alkylhydroperoxidase family enzyme
MADCLCEDRGLVVLGQRAHGGIQPRFMISVSTSMHTKDAQHAGESPVRLNLVAVWREATVFTEAERAALDLTEQGTRIADAAGGVTDEAWANAAKHYDGDQLAALISLIALINTYNRINVITRQPAGDYQPGQWG